LLPQVKYRRIIFDGGQLFLTANGVFFDGELSELSEFFLRGSITSELLEYLLPQAN